MLWAALLPNQPPSDPSRRRDTLLGLSTWCLQFTPKVALVEAMLASPAVVMELEASVRLFGGKRKLVERVREECEDLGVRQLSWAPTTMAGVAIARAGVSNGFNKPLDQLLDAIAFDVLTSVAAHQATLARLGCKTLGDVRRLPRGGMSRRFDAQLLGALDQAYGLRPEAHEWVLLPEDFRQKFELMAASSWLRPAVRGEATADADGRLAGGAAQWRYRIHAALVPRRDAIEVCRRRRRDDGANRPADARHRAPDPATRRAPGQDSAASSGGRLELLATDVQGLEDKGLTLFPEPQLSGLSAFPPFRCNRPRGEDVGGSSGGRRPSHTPGQIRLLGGGSFQDSGLSATCRNACSKTSGDWPPWIRCCRLITMLGTESIPARCHSASAARTSWA
jgi:protein ImuB